MTIPFNGSIVVNGLGASVAVAATLSASILTNYPSFVQLSVNGTDVTVPAPVQNGDMLRVRVCTPTTVQFSQNFTLSYGQQSQRVLVNSQHAPPPSPPPQPSPPPLTLPQALEDVSTAANFSAYATEELSSVVKINSKTKVEQAQEVSTAAAIELAEITETAAEEAANRTAVATILAATNANIASAAAAQGAIDVANVAFTNITTAIVAAKAADSTALTAARAADVDAYATFKIKADARRVAAASAAALSAAADVTASNTCAASTIPPSSDEAVAEALVEDAISDTVLANLLSVARNATVAADNAYFASFQAASAWRQEVVLQGNDARQGAVDVANIATTGISTAMVATQAALNVIKVAERVADAAAALALVTPTVAKETNAWQAYAAAKVIARGQPNLCVNSIIAIEVAEEMKDEADAELIAADERLAAFAVPPPSPPPPATQPATPLPPALPPVAMSASISGNVTLDGYTVDTFGENETAAFANAMSSLLNVPSNMVDVTVTAARRRVLLAAAQVAVSYSIAVPDLAAAKSLQASIRAAPPTNLVELLKAEGLSEVSAAIVAVSDIITPLQVEGDDEEGAEEDDEESLAPLHDYGVAPANETVPPDEVFSAVEGDGVPLDGVPLIPVPPLPEPSPANNTAHYVVGAVDIVGYTPETFDDEAADGFELTVAQSVNVHPFKVSIDTVDFPEDSRRRLLDLSNDTQIARVRFVIKANNTLQHLDVKTMLKIALHDNPVEFAAALRFNGLVSATGVIEVPVDRSAARKTLAAPVPTRASSGADDAALQMAFTVGAPVGFLFALACAVAWYTLVHRKATKRTTGEDPVRTVGSSLPSSQLRQRALH